MSGKRVDVIGPNAEHRPDWGGTQAISGAKRRKRASGERNEFDEFVVEIANVRHAAMTWVYAMDEVALPEGAMAPAYPLGVSLVVARVDDHIYAVSGRCAHMGCPLFTGALDGHSLVCPCHDWSFDIRTGRFLAAPELGLTVYETRSENGKLYVNLV